LQQKTSINTDKVNSYNTQTSKISSASFAKFVDKCPNEESLQPLEHLADTNIIPPVINNDNITISRSTSPALSCCVNNKKTRTKICPSTASCERDKLTYPAKKRYHEWFNSRSVKEDFSVKLETSNTSNGNSRPLTEAEAVYITSSSKTQIKANSFSTHNNYDLAVDSSKTCKKLESDLNTALSSDGNVIDRSRNRSPNLCTHSEEPLQDVSLSNSEIQVADSQDVSKEFNLNNCLSSMPHGDFGEQASKQSNGATPKQSTDKLILPSTDQITPIQQCSLSPAKQQVNLYLQQDSTSPHLSNEAMSPVMDYTLSDTSSLSGSLSPIDIRIPIDNCQVSDASPFREELLVSNN